MGYINHLPMVHGVYKAIYLWFMGFISHLPVFMGFINHLPVFMGYINRLPMDQRANHIFWDAFFNQQPATKGASFVPRCQNKSHWLVDFHGYVHAEIPNSIISIFVGYINPKWCW